MNFFTFMTEEYECQELADQAVTDLKLVIDTEEQVIAAEHDLFSQVAGWEFTLLHLVELIDDNDLLDLIVAVSEKLAEIRDLMDSDQKHNVHLIKEERHLLAKLKEDSRNSTRCSRNNCRRCK